MELELSGKTVLITGGSQGIGLACAEGFAAEGARVLIASRNEAALKAAAADIEKKYATTVGVFPVDLSQSANASALAAACGIVDILVTTPARFLAVICLISTSSAGARAGTSRSSVPSI